MTDACLAGPVSAGNFMFINAQAISMKKPLATMTCKQVFNPSPQTDTTYIFCLMLSRSIRTKEIPKDPELFLATN